MQDFLSFRDSPIIPLRRSPLSVLPGANLEAAGMARSGGEGWSVKSALLIVCTQFELLTISQDSNHEDFRFGTLKTRFLHVQVSQ